MPSPENPVPHSERVSHIINQIDTGLLPGDLITPEHQRLIEDEMMSHFFDPERIGTESWQVSEDTALEEYRAWHEGFFHPRPHIGKPNRENWHGAP